MGVLRVILGDQLSRDISSLADCDKKADVLLMCEVWNEATYVKHHKKKIAFLFAAMRHFAREMARAGYNLDYIKLEDNGNSGSFAGEVERAVNRHRPEKVVVTFPGEYRVLDDMQTWAQRFGIAVEIREDTRFLCSLQAFERWADNRKQLRMEFFYREMRKTHNILMNGREPEGGRWNYDAENRSPADGGLRIPAPYHCKPDATTRAVLALVASTFADHFGDLEPFGYAVTRTGALEALALFISDRLPDFGTYQDAMLQGQPWMYHSHIGLYLNSGLLHPLECVKAAERAYQAGEAPLNAVEGFIRQIIGWREYVRGIYWLKMPEYAGQNFLQARTPLPDFYWSGDTAMNCLRQCIGDTRQHAYAHHIQRLMVLGNFALLCGLDPVAVNEWYLIVYADAYEWVEMPNVSGMVLYADGGYLASKPYAASGAYINKMSNYCQSCQYNVREKNGPRACPFNYLYWGFLLRNKDRFAGNPRMGMMYKTLSRMSEDKIAAIEQDCRDFMEKSL